MKDPKISVIVPVYNVEKYVSKCLDTIIGQTYGNIEIICVNDGSTDGSRRILEEYSKRDSRIKIVDKKNGGLSSARNAGLKVARGEYISFIDSDDWVDKTMIERMYRNAQENDSDIVICAVHQYDETKQKIDDTNPYYTLGYFGREFDNRAFSYEETKPFIMDVCVMAWNKLYRRRLIDECGAEFPDGLIFEDGPFFFSIYFRTKRVSIEREYLYYYRINRKGSIIVKGGKQFLDIIDVVELMYNSIKNLPDYKDIEYTFFRKKVEDFVFRFEHLNSKYRSQFAKKLKNKSSLANPELFPPSAVKGKLRYNYFLFSNIKTGSVFYYDLQKFKLNFMYKIMEIMYKEEGVYYLKYKQIILKLKKSPNIFDIYYSNDNLHVIIMKKIKFKIPFKYSKLEKFNEDD